MLAVFWLKHRNSRCKNVVSKCLIVVSLFFTIFSCFQVIAFALNIAFNIYALEIKLEQGKVPKEVLIAGFVISILFTALLIYLYLVVPYWSYKLLKFEVTTGKFQLPPRDYPIQIVPMQLTGQSGVSVPAYSQASSAPPYPVVQNQYQPHPSFQQQPIGFQQSPQPAYRIQILVCSKLFCKRGIKYLLNSWFDGTDVLVWFDKWLGRKSFS